MTKSDFKPETGFNLCFQRASTNRKLHQYRIGNISECDNCRISGESIDTVNEWTLSFLTECHIKKLINYEIIFTHLRFTKL